MPGAIYYIGRFLQLLGMSFLLMAIVQAGPLGPSPRTFGIGIGVFVAGWLTLRNRIGKS